MTVFDKICAVPTIIVGVIFMCLGVVGLFANVNAHFTLPPIIGAIPFFVGWAMCVVLIKYWSLSNRLREAEMRNQANMRDSYHNEDY